MMSNLYFYTPDFISQAMSLRKPQEESLFILDDIFKNVPPNKHADLEEKAKAINSMYPTLTDFEREFMSLTFALATGVGKTRLMGAFITYLYCNHGIRNFFVVAPGTTIYEKLKTDLGDPSSPKYVFKGLGCFNNPPMLISDEDYRTKQLSLFQSEINLFVYNIDKFNNENAKMHQLNEYLGASFFEELSNLDDLVLLMDESHHYRAKAGWSALNELNPLLGLELTATPLVPSGNRQIPFKNVVYEYPLSAAIRDGYTRTPYALTRMNIDVHNIGEIETDKMMLRDALLFHEEIKNELISYAADHNERVVKPFMLVVCKDTEHAERIKSFVCSDEFGNGEYINKTIIVHSKQRGSESDENLKLLLDVERTENPVEIVIHVNKLKEGWDVNNLFTIVPLRTATSQILREQMVGRGLRLPFGKRTGVERIDMVALAAHDNFNDLLAKAQAADSIFKAGNVIKAESLEKTQTTRLQVSWPIMERASTDTFYEESGLERTESLESQLNQINQTVLDIVKTDYSRNAHNTNQHTNDDEYVNQITTRAVEVLKENDSTKDIYENYMSPMEVMIRENALEAKASIEGRYIPIPTIKVTYDGVKEYRFIDFDLDMTKFTQVPVANQILIQNLQDSSDSKVLDSHQYVELEKVEPVTFLAKEIVTHPSIDYEKSKDLLLKLIKQLIKHFADKFGNDGLNNILLMFKKQISREIISQMLEHRYLEQGNLREAVSGLKKTNNASTPSFSVEQHLFDDYEGSIKRILFNGICKGVFSAAKFDSRPELILARILERETGVIKWLRPAPTEFNISYGDGKQYEPDFVVETDDMIYLVEVKGEDKENDADVLAKKERAANYCNIVTDWAKKNGLKEWRHVFIPSQEIQMDVSFAENLAHRFIVQ